MSWLQLLVTLTVGTFAFWVGCAFIGVAIRELAQAVKPTYPKDVH